MRACNLTGQIITAVRSVVPDASVPLHEPFFGGNEWDYVKECLDSGWVSSVGAYVDRFEEALAVFTGARRAVAVVNGTAALHVCLQLVGVEYGDEVLIPALTFVGTANAVVYCGAVPHFVDSSEQTLGIDSIRLEEYLSEIAEIGDQGCYNRITGRRIRAVIPMHVFGHPVDLDPLLAVCARYRLELVEDAAESLGSYYKGRHTGTFGRCAALSFNGNKIITSGGGGAILTNDDELAQAAKHLTTTAKLPHRWELNHDRIGYNYRLPNINAALGCAQLELLPMFVAQKRALAQSYLTAFDGIEEVCFFKEACFSRSNYWLNALLLHDAVVDRRDDVLHACNQAGIMARPAWTPLNRLPMFAGCPRMALDVAENLAARIVNIPSSAVLGARS